MPETQVEFWDYSLALYRSADVEDHCMALQNEYAFDVNLVLFCVWFGHQYGELPAPLLEDAVAFSKNWRQSIVQPLRSVRTTMKSNNKLAAGTKESEFTKLKEDVKKLELQAEKLQQDELHRLASAIIKKEALGKRQGAQLTNLNALCASMPVEPDETLTGRLEAIVAASSQLA